MSDDYTPRECITELLSERDALRAEVERLRDDQRRVVDRVVALVVERNLLLRAAQSLHRAWKREREEVERLKQSMVHHFQREHLAGDGPEIDRWRAEVAKLKADEQWLAMGRDYREHRLLAACQSLHKRWKAAKAP